jgi:outer membrane biosynthesis protein TonB
MRSKRIERINTNQSVPKKNKIVQNKNQPPSEAGGSSTEVKADTPSRARSSTTSRKNASPRRKKAAPAQKAKVTTPAQAGTTAGPSDDEIRLRAYFISERRRRFALPGDVDSDWLEARRQLLSEASHR